jgi:hypothetical protein
MSESIQPPLGSREERIAYNEAWCRNLNERMAKWMGSGVSTEGFRCECWRVGCEERIQLSGEEWREVRSQANRFAVAPEHIAADLEAVVKEYPHLWLIEKRGEAGGVVEKLGLAKAALANPLGARYCEDDGRSRCGNDRRAAACP